MKADNEGKRKHEQHTRKRLLSCKRNRSHDSKAKQICGYICLPCTASPGRNNSDVGGELRECLGF